MQIFSYNLNTAIKQMNLSIMVMRDIARKDRWSMRTYCTRDSNSLERQLELKYNYTRALTWYFTGKSLSCITVLFIVQRCCALLAHVHPHNALLTVSSGQGGCVQVVLGWGNSWLAGTYRRWSWAHSLGSHPSFPPPPTVGENNVSLLLVHIKKTSVLVTWQCVLEGWLYRRSTMNEFKRTINTLSQCSPIYSSGGY